MSLSKDEWISRCAAQYVKRGGLMPEQAMGVAEITFESQSALGESDPEQAADDDMDCWSDDE